MYLRVGYHCEEDDQWSQQDILLDLPPGPVRGEVYVFNSPVEYDIRGSVGILVSR